jgi:hypothetical protein
MGSGGWAKLYGDRLADSSLLECAVATRWVFLYMLARADKTGRFRCASVPGLARAAAVTLPEAAAAVRELEAPDPDSTSPEEEGRRILRIPGGWQIVNKAKYRDYQTAKQKADAEKKQRQREAARRNRQELEAENVRLREQIGGGTCPGTSPGLPGTSAQEEREQRLETSNGERISGADAPAPPSSADVKAKGNCVFRTIVSGDSGRS